MLVSVVEVDVGIAAQLGADACCPLIETEARFEYRRVLVPVGILVVDTQAIIAAQQQFYLLVGDAQTVVRINLRRIETLLEVLDVIA